MTKKQIDDLRAALGRADLAAAELAVTGEAKLGTALALVKDLALRLAVAERETEKRQNARAKAEAKLVDGEIAAALSKDADYDQLRAERDAADAALWEARRESVVLKRALERAKAAIPEALAKAEQVVGPAVRTHLHEGLVRRIHASLQTLAEAEDEEATLIDSLALTFDAGNQDPVARARTMRYVRPLRTGLLGLRAKTNVNSRLCGFEKEAMENGYAL